MHYIQRRHGIPVVSATAQVPPSGPVLQPSDFTYLGVATVPTDDTPNGIRFAYSTGALSGRVVSGNIHLFITGATDATGWPDPVYECLWTGVGTQMTLVTNHWDVTQGKRDALGHTAGWPIHGLFWDTVSQRLLWTYVDAYNPNGNNDPCLGSSSLDPVSAAGPWRITTHAKWTGGYMTAIPSAIQSAMFGRGFLGGAAVSSGNASAPWGVAANAFTAPDPSTTPDTSGGSTAAVTGHSILYSDITFRQARIADIDLCDWTHVHEQNANGNQPENNPTQNGSGCTIDGDLCGVNTGPISGVFQSLDAITASAWINGPNKQGVVYIGQIARTMANYMSEYGIYGRNHQWYGPVQGVGAIKLCPHGMSDTRYGNTGTGDGTATMQASMYIYDPADLIAVAAGTKSSIGVVPSTDGYNLGNIAHSGSPFPELVTSIFQFGGAWFEPTSKTLFVAATYSDFTGPEGKRPVVHAFSVNC